MASEDEERLRLACEAKMREWHPTGRVIHELVLQQGGTRLDVACVMPDRLIIAEIKSKKDTLTRLPHQLAMAKRRGCEVWLVMDPKHVDELDRLSNWSRRKECSAFEIDMDLGAKMHGVRTFVETTDGSLKVIEPRFPQKYDLRHDPYERFDLLWAQEMRDALGLHFGGASIAPSKKMTRGEMTRLAMEYMSGGEIRRAVNVQLRARGFPRADPPIDWREPDAPPSRLD